MSAEATTERRVEGAGVELAVSERGSGLPVLLIHGIASDRAIWNETIAALGEGVRAISYDRRGYGKSGAPEPYDGTTIEEQAEDAAAVLLGSDAVPAVICAHSSGAIIALDLLKRRPELVRSAVLIEPPLLSLSPVGSAWASNLVERAREGAAEHGERGAAAAVMMEICGPTGLEVAGRERSERALASARTIAIEAPIPAQWEFSRRELGAIEVPVTVLCGTRSPQVFRDAASELAAMLGAGKLRELDSAHIVQVEHPEEVAEEVAAIAGL